MLGQKVRKARHELGMTQAQLAEGHFSRAYVSAVERGIAKPSSEILQIIAERLGKPLSYFTSYTEVEAPSLEVLLAKAGELVNVGALREAELMLRDIDIAAHEGRSKAYYYCILVQLECQRSNIKAAISAANTACKLYLSIGDEISAWQVLYRLTYRLSTMGLFDSGIEVALKAIHIVMDKPCFEREEKVTYYLLGFLYYAMGKIAVAQRCFEQAMLGNQISSDLAVRALLGKASCAIASGNWHKALDVVEEALQISAQHDMKELMAESLSCAVICLIRLGLFASASSLLREILAMPGITVSEKRKACREILLISTDGLPESLMAQAASELNILRGEACDLPEWVYAYEEWALTRFNLIKQPKNIVQTCNRFAATFIHMQRYTVAAEILCFGSKLLAEQGDITSAFEMLEKACEVCSQ